MREELEEGWSPGDVEGTGRAGGSIGESWRTSARCGREAKSALRPMRARRHLRREEERSTSADTALDTSRGCFIHRRAGRCRDMAEEAGSKTGQGCAARTKTSGSRHNDLPSSFESLQRQEMVYCS